MTPYEQGYIAGLEKVGVSRQLAEQAFGKVLRPLIESGVPTSQAATLMRSLMKSHPLAAARAGAKGLDFSRIHALKKVPSLRGTGPGY